MGQRKVKKKDIVKCKGFNVAPCFSCRRWSPLDAKETLIGGFSTYRSQNVCEHYFSKMQ